MEIIEFKLNIADTDEIVASRQKGFVVVAVRESAIKRWGLWLAMRIAKIIKAVR